MDKGTFNFNHLMETGEYLCPVCGKVMDILPTGGEECPNCGFQVDEGEYTGWIDEDDENENSFAPTYQEYLEIFEGKNLDEEDNDIPEGCQACGGPYPNCIDSCSLFDD